MPITNLFSMRQKTLRGDISDVYTYDNLPEELRNQIIHIWYETIGNNDSHYVGYSSAQWYRKICTTIAKEHGKLKLFKYDTLDYLEQLTKYFITLEDVEKQLDVVELTFIYIDRLASTDEEKNVASEAIKELNTRFKQHGVGFQFEEGKIIKIDSEFIHSEVVKPALSLLSGECYSGAQEEFLKAYEHYRSGHNKEALNDCLKSFESTMKAICAKNNWHYENKATASKLIDIIFVHEIIPKFWQSNLQSLVSLLKAGIPTGRNKQSAHGQGKNPTTVPDHIVSYMLHMTASTIVFLIKAEEELHK